MLAHIINWAATLIAAIIMLIFYIFCAESKREEVRGGGSNSVDSSTNSTAGASQCSQPVSKDPLRILTFNVEYEATNYSPDDVAEIIHNLGADVVVLNEAHEIEGRVGSVIDISKYTSKLADALEKSGLNFVYSHDWAIIASTRSILQPYRGRANKYLDTAALIDGKFYVISAHLTDYPYQPFQLAHIPYCYDTCQKNICAVGVSNSVSGMNGEGMDKAISVDKEILKCSIAEMESQMIEEAKLARGAEVDMIVDAIETLREEGLPILLAGDFNEPSHLDWSDEAVRAGEQPLRVRFPTSSRIVSAGMTDLFRAVHPDVVAVPGHTWPARPLTREYLADLSHGMIKEQISTPADRIDFIYGSGFTPLRAEIVVTPSDHNAVMVEVEGL